MAEMDLVASHFDRDLTSKEHAQLEDWLSESPDRVLDFVAWSVMETAIEELYEEAHAAAHQDEAFRQLVMQSELSTAKDDADHPLWYAGLAAHTQDKQESASSRLSFKDAMDLLGYACVQVAKTKPFKRIAAVAAVILIALVAWQVWAPAPSVQDGGSLPLAGSTEPDPPSVATANVVATLTANHDAIWAEGSLVTGSPLRVGDRLNLTAGFAEITTNDGAIAILQAPTTVELLNNDNAIRLHSGKLVGICETESSKGFVVKTDHAEITDIGTEFGVDASRDGLTRLHVFRGEVRVAVKDDLGQLGEAVSLQIGQAVNISADGGLLAVALDADRFAGQRGYTLAGQIKESFESGISLASGDSESSEFILLVPEQKSVRLEQPLQVSLPGDTPVLKHDHAQKVLYAGTQLDSYTVHFDSAELDATKTITLRAEIHFSRPILGVVLDNQQYHDTSQLLGSRDVQYASPDAQVSIDGSTDQIMISPDGKTIRLELSAVGASAGIDQVRILVQAK